MATTVSSSAASVTPEKAKLKAGVPPLRAGAGHEFMIRRLHSLSGIIPVGAFLAEHILVSNLVATKGPVAYAHQVQFLGGLPMVFWLELLGIWIPLAFHALVGFYIWAKAAPNLVSYPWLGNWMYSLQRWTGGIAFVYIVVHMYTLRFSGIDLHDNPAASFGKVQQELANPWYFAFYIVGLVSAAWHFAYGIWLFCAKWGIIIGERARKRGLVVAMGIFLLIAGAGLASLRAFKTTPQQPVHELSIEELEKQQPSHP
jgi:succinate dehydrogenase / fumarate reductase, cytochrome b subunit